VCLSNKDEIFGVGFLTNEIIVLWRRRRKKEGKWG